MGEELEFVFFIRPPAVSPGTVHRFHSRPLQVGSRAVRRDGRTILNTTAFDATTHASSFQVVWSALPHLLSNPILIPFALLTACNDVLVLILLSNARTTEGGISPLDLAATLTGRCAIDVCSGAQQ